MRKTIKKVCAVILAASLAVSGLALAPNASIAAKKPALNKKKITINVGSTYKLKIKNAGRSAKVTWKTSKKAVASITKKSGKGKSAYAAIKGVSAGTAKITATYKDGKTKKKLTCAVTVASADGTSPAQTTTTAPVTGATNQPAGTVTTNAPAVTQAPGTTTTETPIEPEATAEPTVRPTRTPRPSATPTPEPTAKPTLPPDASGALKLSDVTTGSDGAATFSDGKIVINDTNSSDGATNVFIPLPSKVMYEETVTIVLKGSSSKADNAFRVWIGDGGSNGAAEIKSISNLAVGEFSETFTLKAKSADVAQGGNIGTNDIDTLTIKSTGTNGPRITGITIDSIDIYYTDRGAVLK